MRSAPKIKRLIAAHKALFATAVVVLVGVLGFVGYGIWQQMSANAAGEGSLTAAQRQYIVPVNGKLGCRLAGREWNAAADNGKGDCEKKCRIQSVTYVKATESMRGHCEGYVVKAIGANQCIGDLHRYYVNETGCARRPNQENTNDSPQCIPGYPNYLADKNTDKCIAQTIVGGGGNGNGNGGGGSGGGGGGNNTPAPNPNPNPNPNPGTPSIPEPVKPPSTATAKDCKLLGRVWDTKDKKCKTECMQGAGTLLVGLKSKVKYCGRAVAVTTHGNEETCANKLHRVWLVEGCARRPDQKDATRSKSEPLIQCHAGFNFYNADFKNKAEDKETLRDVCEQSKTVALANEAAGTPGIALPEDPNDPNTPGSGNNGGGNDNTNNNDQDASEYKIIVYTEKNFKGASLVVRGDTPGLANGWNNNIESYKVISGRWQLCEDAEYQTNCIKPWASDPDMRAPLKDDGKKRNEGDTKKRDEENKRTNLSNKVSSLRPVLLKTFEDTAEDVLPACQSADGTEAVALEDGSCPAGTTLTCPDGLVLKNRECKQVVLNPSLIVPVDKSFKKEKNGERDCHLLGREWIGQPEDGEVDNGGNYGCSVVTCRLDRDGRPKKVVYNVQDKDQKITDTYCVSYKYDAPYAVKLDKNPAESKKKCDERHRIWIQQVRLCAQVPNRKDRNQTIPGAEQCAGSNRVYYIFKETTKQDECFTQTLFERAQDVVQSTGGVLEAALRQGPRAYCNTLKSGNYHWNGEKCVIDRKTCPNGKSIPVTGHCPQPSPGPGGGNGTGQGSGGSEAPSGESWSTFCARLGRSASGNSCSTGCNDSNKARNPQHLSYGWDYCDSKGQVCSSYGTGGTKNCGGGTTPCTPGVGNCQGPVGPVREVTCTDALANAWTGNYLNYCASSDLGCDNHGDGYYKTAAYNQDRTKFIRICKVR